MVFDSPLSAHVHASLGPDPRAVRGGSGGAYSTTDRERFLADVQALELRVAIIDDRFDRLAARPDDAFQAFRRDTLTRMRSVAERARDLEVSGGLDEPRRRHVAAVLTLVRHRVTRLDAQHEKIVDRRARRRDGPDGSQSTSSPALLRAIASVR